MSGIKIFEREEFGQVRVVMRDGEPWFVASDVATALGYTNPSRSVQDHCKYAELFKTTDSVVLDIPARGLLIIPESDVYRLIMRSNLPNAEKFQDWVTDEVLPSIRKTGQYGGYDLPRIPTSFSDALRMIADIEEEKQLALEQRDYYRRTKAEIGSRREATAMATASAAVRKVARLEDELGRGKKFKAVRAIPWLLQVFRPSKGMYSSVGKQLKRISADLGYPVEKVATPEFPDGVNAYHFAVIGAFRDALSTNPSMLIQYRNY